MAKVRRCCHHCFWLVLAVTSSLWLPASSLVRSRSDGSRREVAATNNTVNARPTQSDLVRIELENVDQLQFVGSIRVGLHDAQTFRVFFDTGSSDIWVPSVSCRACAGTQRYNTATCDARCANDHFQVSYGSGDIAGSVVAETIHLSDALAVENVRLGIVDTQATEIQRFASEGVVGLGMDALARATTPGLLQMLARQKRNQYRRSLPSSLQPNRPVLFSLYLSALPNERPPSQLIVGGVDNALVGGNSSAAWFYFRVLRDRKRRAYGYWSLQLHHVAIGDQTLTMHDVSLPSTMVAQSTATSGDPSVCSTDDVAIIDSGSSLLLLPGRSYGTAIEVLQHTLGDRLHRNSQSAHNATTYSCRRCSHSSFPSLVFQFATHPRHSEATPLSNTVASDSHSAPPQRFVLQGRDYVRCERGVCSPQLARSTNDAFVLGAVFLRAYYTSFDYTHKRVGFACPGGNCSGGVKPPLLFGGDTALREHTRRARVLACSVAVSALVSLATLSWFRARWFMVPPHCNAHSVTESV